MRNRFNLNESEKSRIRGLHGIQGLHEQNISDPAGNPDSNVPTDDTTTGLPDGNYMLRGNCGGYKILTRPVSWESIVINDGVKDNEKGAILTDEHEDALYTGYLTDGPCVRCPCDFEYNATITGGKLVSPSGGAWSGEIIEGGDKYGEAGSGEIAPPEITNLINKVKQQGIKNVSDAMVKAAPFDGYSYRNLVGGTFGGMEYVWDCTGVEGFRQLFGRVEGYITTEKNSYVSKIKNADTGELITDAANDGNFFGFVSKPDYQDQFIVYTSTSGPKAVKVKLN